MNLIRETRANISALGNYEFKLKKQLVRALARKARGPGFDPQLRCLNFSFLRPSVSAFFLRLVCWNGLIEATD